MRTIIFTKRSSFSEKIEVLSEPESENTSDTESSTSSEPESEEDNFEYGHLRSKCNYKVKVFMK